MSLYRIVIAGVLSLCLLNACRNENNPGENARLLKYTVVRLGDSVLYSYYSYDTQMRLIQIKDTNNNGNVFQTFIEYNSQGNPFKATTQYGSDVTLDSLVYENGMAVQKLSKYPNNIIYVATHSYVYDGIGRLICDSTYGLGYTNYLYNGDNDVVKSEQFYISSTGVIRTQGITASYNSHINPYDGIGNILYLIRNSELLLTKHNRVHAVYEQYNRDSFTEDYTYEYENGLLKKMIRYRGDVGSIYYTYEFYYD